MFCPQCGAQTEQSTKFCKSCGLKLSEHGRLLKEAPGADGGNIEQYRREKRLSAGFVLTMVSFFNLTLFFLIFGFRAIGLAPEPSQQSLIAMFISFLASGAIPGLVGLIMLFSSGYFKGMKERQLRAELALLEQKRKTLDEASQKLQTPLPHAKQEVEASSITEHTTRELKRVTVTNRNFSGE